MKKKITILTVLLLSAVVGFLHLSCGLFSYCPTGLLSVRNVSEVAFGGFSVFFVTLFVGFFMAIFFSKEKSWLLWGAWLIVYTASMVLGIIYVMESASGFFKGLTMLFLTGALSAGFLLITLVLLLIDIVPRIRRRFGKK